MSKSGILSILIKKMERAFVAEIALQAKSDSILLNLAVQYSIFCGLLFDLEPII